MYIPATLKELIEYSKELTISHRTFNKGADLYKNSKETGKK